MTSTEITTASKVMLGTTEAVAMYIGSNKIWEQQTGPVGRLPQGYTELEYISSTQTGGQYINLGIKLYETVGVDYDIAIKFSIKGNGLNTSQQATMFNSQDPNNSPWPGNFIRTSTNSVVGRYIGGTDKDNTIGYVTHIIELSEKTPPNKNVTNLNNPNNTTHQYKASLFCGFSDTNDTPQRFAYADLYYFKLWVAGTLVRDMVPCKNSNNVVGLYDLVNNVFYTSPNGALFVAGPTV